MLNGTRRSGFTLAELLVVLVAGGIVLAVFTTLGVRQQRLYADLESAVSGAAQLRQSASLLPIELRAIAPQLGDIAVARDTAIQFRATIATAVVCEVRPDGLLLVASRTAGGTVMASYLTAPLPRDTAWVLAVAGDQESWRPAPIASIAWQPGCALAGPGDIASGSASLFVKLDPEQAVRGTAVRITRPVRYSLYRASDSRWYLGQREWNPANAQFNSVQPVSGPFVRAAEGGMRITYRQPDGALLALPLSDPAAVGLVDITLRTDLRRRGGWTVGGNPSALRDSIRIVVRLRNR